MHKRKAIVGTILAVALVLLQVAAVSAAPLSQDGTVTCTVTDVQISTNSSGFDVVQVTCDDGSSYGLTSDSAGSLGLVTTDENGDLVVSDTAVGSTVDITSDMLQADPCVLPEGANQPVSEALTSFFCGADSLGLSYDDVQGLRDEGFGYGLIAQACFMAKLSDAHDTTTCQSILEAKQNHDELSLTIGGNEITASNWGQLRKAVFDNQLKSDANLGFIMSGRSDSPTGDSTTTTHGKSGDHSNNGHHGNPNK